MSSKTDTVRVRQAVILRAIRDLASTNHTTYKSAADYVRSARFSMDCEKAEYPAELRDSLKEMVLLSIAQRRFLAYSITGILEKKWGKKNPAGAGL